MGITQKNNINIVWMAGGLGNQLFQYAFGLYLENITGLSTVFDVSWYRKPSKQVTIRKLEIESIVGDLSDKSTIENTSKKYKSLKYYVNKLTKCNLFNVQYVNELSFMSGSFGTPAYFQGYWQDAILLVREICRIAEINQITINWFSDGKDFIPYHRDWNSENSEILILTLNEGDPRTFYLKALSLTKNSLEKKIGIKTEMGTIIKLCGNTNKKYKHGIQMEPNLNSRRISLSFRKFLKD